MYIELAFSSIVRSIAAFVLKVSSEVARHRILSEQAILTTLSSLNLAKFLFSCGFVGSSMKLCHQSQPCIGTYDGENSIEFTGYAKFVSFRFKRWHLNANLLLEL